MLGSLIFDLTTLHQKLTELLPTKRNIVGIATRFYDPLEYITPHTVQFKILFQELCKERLEWDEVLIGSLLEKWKALVSSFQPITLTIPRYYFQYIERDICTYRLVGFCDASQKAYAALVYLCASTDSNATSQFVASKTRVSPANKEQTIPQLELLSSVLLGRLIDCT